MVDTSLFGRLKRIFSTDVIIRNVGGNQLKVMDTDRIQQLGTLQTNSLFDRYNKIYTTTGGLNFNYNRMEVPLFIKYLYMVTQKLLLF